MGQTVPAARQGHMRACCSVWGWDPLCVVVTSPSPALGRPASTWQGCGESHTQQGTCTPCLLQKRVETPMCHPPARSQGTACKGPCPATLPIHGSRMP